jgi:hypothetical protein
MAGVALLSGSDVVLGFPGGFLSVMTGGALASYPREIVLKIYR